jgi:dTDP-4-amino-4,6-dideoxygalactose transaminase
MSKFDLSEKIKLIDLINSLISESKVFPFELLQRKLNLSTNWQENYFSWGRNAFYYLFKSLPFKALTLPAFTCPTLTEAAEKANKKVVLTEIDLESFNLDINKIPPKTECLVVVHTFGNPVNVGEIRKKFRQKRTGKKLFIIEDCAHALFSKINNRFVGNDGDALLFSLYKQVANLNGALLLNKENSKVARSSNLGGWIPWQPRDLKRLIIKLAGPHQFFLDFKRREYLPAIEKQELNSDRPSNLVFNLFEKGFRQLEKEIEGRRKIASWYYQEVKKYKFIIPQKSETNSRPSYYHFVIRLIPELASQREKIVLKLRKRNIFVDRLWYQAPIVKKKYQEYQKKCPQALLLAKTVINLPIYSNYTKNDVHALFKRLDETIKDLIPNS